MLAGTDRKQQGALQEAVRQPVQGVPELEASAREHSSVDHLASPLVLVVGLSRRSFGLTRPEEAPGERPSHHCDFGRVLVFWRLLPDLCFVVRCEKKGRKGEEEGTHVAYRMGSPGPNWVQV